MIYKISTQDLSSNIQHLEDDDDDDDEMIKMKKGIMMMILTLWRMINNLLTMVIG